MSTVRVEFDDVQGLLRWGHRRYAEAVFLLLQVKDPGAARAWLAQVPVADAVPRDTLPASLLQVAVSCDGLRALGVDEDVVQRFSPEFLSGMHGLRSRSSRLGDVEANAPLGWDWGSGTEVPHLAVLLYALPGRLGGARQALEAACAAAFRTVATLETSERRDTEPFGFADGISQPLLDWEGRRAVRDETREDYTNLSCLGEFLLGHPNEYGAYTDRPLLDPVRDAAAALPRAADAPERADLGRNGSYLVLRQLQQDVPEFWRSLDRCAGGDAPARLRLAEALVGRTLAGMPLVERSAAPIEGVDGVPNQERNAFTYEVDPQGLRCPIGAHVRRTNPRNADLPPGPPGLLSRLVRILGFDAAARHQDLVASTRLHRLLRRGRAYGPPLSPADALSAGGPTPDCGLHFIALNANIGRQFEFVQGAWVAGTRFGGLPGEGDPLLGSRAPGTDGRSTSSFSMPQPDGPDRRVDELPRFVTVRGGAYFFLPGLRALRWIAGVR